MRSKKTGPSDEQAAQNGILNRRIFLEGALAAGVVGAPLAGAAAEPLAVETWMKILEPDLLDTGSHRDSRRKRFV